MDEVPDGSKRRTAFRRADLRKFEVNHDAINQAEVDEFETILNRAEREADLQQHLAANPRILVQKLRGGWGRWVIPSPRFGAEHVPDFIVGEYSSLGVQWTLVELESPRRRLFNNRGDPAEYLNHAIRQIADWRDWLITNRDYAIRSRSDQGLGLVDIDGRAPAWIIIGRRDDEDEKTRRRRAQLGAQSGIEIHTYDWLLDAAHARVHDMEAWKRRSGGGND